MDKLEFVLDVVAYLLGGTFILGLGLAYILFKDVMRPRFHVAPPKFQRPTNRSTAALTALDAQLSKIQSAAPPERTQDIATQMGMIRRWMDTLNQRTHPVQKRYFLAFRALESAWRALRDAHGALQGMPYRKRFGQKNNIEKLSRVYAGIYKQERQAWETLVTIDKIVYNDLSKRGALRPAILQEPWAVKTLAQLRSARHGAPAVSSKSVSKATNVSPPVPTAPAVSSKSVAKAANVSPPVPTAPAVSSKSVAKAANVSPPVPTAPAVSSKSVAKAANVSPPVPTAPAAAAKHGP